MMEYGDSLIRAEWDALMEREREAAQEGTDDLRPPFFVLDIIEEVRKIVKAKVGPVEADRILEVGSGHIPHLDSLMRAKRATRREREREAAQAILLDAIWRVVERTVDGDERIAANVAVVPQTVSEAMARAEGASGKPATSLTVNRIVLALRKNRQSKHEVVTKGISQLERDGFYALLFAETQNPIEHLFWVIHMHRIEDAFDAALDAAGKIEDPCARKKARKGLRDLLNMHLALRRRAAKATP